MKLHLLALACLTMPVLAGDDVPWPAPVDGFVAPAANEHPRLFFRRGDLDELRARSKTEEGRAIISRLKATLGGGGAMPTNYNPQTRAYEANREMPEGTYSISHAAGFGFLYQLTGEKKYADLGRECFEKAWAGVRDRDAEARYSWVAPGGCLRGGPSIGWYALGYDLCFDGWDEAFRTKVAREIQDYSQQEKGKGAEGSGSLITLERLAVNPKHPPGSNHYGAQVGGAAIALLAIRGDTGTDAAKVEKWYAAVRKNLIVEMTEGWGDHGWFAEGEGPSGVAADTSLIPAFQALRVAGGLDFISPRPNVPWMTMKWVMLSQINPGFKSGKDVYPLHSNTYDHNVWAREGMSGSGQFAQGFGAILPEQRPALLWLYDHLFGAADAKRGAPFDTINDYPHRAILSFVNWPFGVEAKNPGEILPRAVEDKSVGHYMFRNRWQDGDDIIVSALLRSTKGHYDVKAGQIIVWGLGQKSAFPVRVSGATKFWSAGADGGVVSTSAGSLGVDFSKKSGADAVIVLGGPIRGTVPSKTKGTVATAQVVAGTNTFVLMTLSADKKHPAPAAEGDAVKLGDQTIAMENGNIVFR